MQASARQGATLALSAMCTVAVHGQQPIIHDAEHMILRAQHGERWAREDSQINERLAELRRAHRGQPPNFVCILLDDLGFGEIGMPSLDVIRGYSTPRISELADQGLSFTFPTRTRH